MVLPASLGVSRAPRYSGRYPGRYQRFAYGGVTLFAPPFQVALLRLHFLTSRRSYVAPNPVLQPHVSNARTLCADMVWARPRSLATTRGVSVLISFPTGTEMFQFPAFAPDYAGDPVLPGPGCPIRESSGQRLFASSPKLIAGSYALHRLLTPRHPPCALLYLTHQCLRPCARLRALGHSVYHHPYSRCQRGRAGSLTCPLARAWSGRAGP